jgi:hypothetical protein
MAFCRRSVMPRPAPVADRFPARLCLGTGARKQRPSRGAWVPIWTVEAVTGEDEPIEVDTVGVERGA